MFVYPQDLAFLAGGGGHPFEAFLFDLVVAEGGRHGIPSHAIQWDPRTNLGDGGRDIVVREGHQDPPPHFIPQSPSIWSAKSGEGGLEPSKLKEELKASKHPKVVEHLREGKPFVYCLLQEVSHDGREKLEKAIGEAAFDEGFAPGLVELRTVADLTAIASRHPGVIMKHLPAVRSRFAGVLTLDEWLKEDSTGYNVPWVDMPRHVELRDLVRNHLRSRGSPNVLHIAGLSGVGKTRTVLEACRGEEGLDGVLYVRTHQDFQGQRLLDHIRRTDHLRALIVIDEVPLEALRDLMSQVRGYPQRLRLVTIGPAGQGERDQPSNNIFILPEADTETDVLEVVRQAGPGLSEAVQQSIARWSNHDLRLAVFLVEATQGSGEFQHLPIQDGDALWQRVVTLFAKRLDNAQQFQDTYRYLTVSIDVGCSGEDGLELEYLAEHFATPAIRLHEAMGCAVSCGLGLRTPNFFEATPRALAVHLFRTRVWPALEPAAKTFLAGIPSDRLLRRFIERCQECGGEERRQMEEAIAAFFYNALGNRDIHRLANRQVSRLFQTWAELDPQGGLPWLRDAVAGASDDDLRAFDGQPDHTGGWRGRRQILWLCERLASFREHFDVCETILFRLAQVETEPTVGNNSVATWSGLFFPVLGNTEVPFPQRADLLLRRLADSDGRTLPLVFSAVCAALDSPGFRLALPEVVGGRLVPESWRPGTYQEWKDLRKDLGVRALQTLGRLPPPLRREGMSLVVGQLSLFIHLGLMGEMQELLDDAAEDEALRRNLRAALGNAIRFRQQRGGNGDSPPDAVLEQLQHWRERLAPTDLAARIKELTAQQAWSVMERTEP